MTRVPPSLDSDLTSVAGAATDVAPLGRHGSKPAHELTADEEADVVDWDRIAALEEFKALLAAKRKFIVPATAFFITYYFALPILVGYFPSLMERRLVGAINLAYVFALSQFFVSWGLAMYYAHVANKDFDRLTRELVDELK